MCMHIVYGPHVNRLHCEDDGGHMLLLGICLTSHSVLHLDLSAAAAGAGGQCIS